MKAAIVWKENTNEILFDVLDIDSNAFLFGPQVQKVGTVADVTNFFSMITGKLSSQSTGGIIEFDVVMRQFGKPTTMSLYVERAIRTQLTTTQNWSLAKTQNRGLKGQKLRKFNRALAAMDFITLQAGTKASKGNGQLRDLWATALHASEKTEMKIRLIWKISEGITSNLKTADLKRFEAWYKAL